jgi:uncharacterized membrane protein
MRITQWREKKRISLTEKARVQGTTAVAILFPIAQGDILNDVSHSHSEAFMMHKSTTTLGLDERWERVLTYLFFWISGIFFLVVERNRTVRQHAWQSTIVFGALGLAMFAVNMLKVMLSVIPILSYITNFGLGLLWNILFWTTILLWLWLMAMAFLHPHYRLPFFNSLFPIRRPIRWN